MTAKELDLPSLHERADALAELAHYGHVDKIGAPYIEHPRMVAAYAVEMLPAFEHWKQQVLDPIRVVTIALLHDTVEDTWVTQSILRGLFPHSVCDDVEALTEAKGKTRVQYRERIVRHRSLYPLLVKAADLRHNTDLQRMLALPRDSDRTHSARKYTDDVAALRLNQSPFAGYFYHLEDFLPHPPVIPPGGWPHEHPNGTIHLHADGEPCPEGIAT